MFKPFRELLSIVCDLDRVFQRGVDRAILLFTDLDRFGKLFRINAFTDGFEVNVYLAEAPGRIFILCAFGGDFQLL